MQKSISRVKLRRIEKMIQDQDEDIELEFEDLEFEFEMLQDLEETVLIFTSYITD